MSKYKFSFIVASRNDNHGGNMKVKNNYFVNSWINQVNKNLLSAELILIEWNPPKNEPNLEEMINLKFKLHQGARVKIITVPREVHKEFAHANKINLYQMIAKNVGIKRAEGEYVICTNTDILFTQKLLNEINNISFKDENIVYRADRHDVDLDNFDNYNIDKNDFYKIKTVINTKYYSHDLIKNKKYYVNRSLKNYLFNFFPIIKFIFFDNEPTDNKMILNLRKLKEYITNPIKEFFLKIKSRSIFSYDWYYIFFKTFPRLLTSIPNEILKLFSIITYPFVLFYYYITKKHSKIPKITKYLPAYFIYFLRPFIEALSIVFEKKLNTNACGDFTMATKKNWDKIQGYWELDAYSWHIDSIAMWHFLFKKSKFKNFKNFTYHINHSVGSGFTPGSTELFKRLDKQNIKYLSQSDLISSINILRKLGSYNNEKWGLENFNFKAKIITE